LLDAAKGDTDNAWQSRTFNGPALRPEVREIISTVELFNVLQLGFREHKGFPDWAIPATI
jgi:hypothetical protein